MLGRKEIKGSGSKKGTHSPSVSLLRSFSEVPLSTLIYISLNTLVVRVSEKCSHLTEYTIACNKIVIHS